MPTERSRIDPMSWLTYTLQQGILPSLRPFQLAYVFAFNNGLADGEGPQLRSEPRPRPGDFVRLIRGGRSKGGQKGSGCRDLETPRPLGRWEVAAQVKGTMASDLTHRVSDITPGAWPPRAASVFGRTRTRKRKMNLAYEMRQRRDTYPSSTRAKGFCLSVGSLRQTPCCAYVPTTVGIPRAQAAVKHGRSVIPL